MANGFERPDSVIKRGTVGERAQLHGSLGSTAQYAERTRRYTEGGTSRGNVEKVEFLPYNVAMDIVRQADDEITARYEARGERREKGFFLEQLSSTLAEQLDEWLAGNGLIEEEEAVTVVTPRNSLQTALDVFHGVDAFLDIEIPGRYRATITLDVTKNTAKLSGQTTAKADFTVPLLEFAGGTLPKNPQEAAQWKKDRQAAKAQIEELARAIVGRLWTSHHLERDVTRWANEARAAATGVTRRRAVY